MKTLQIRPRYHRWYVDAGVEWTEVNTGYADLAWEVPLSQAALVLLDVWTGHFLADTLERIERIVAGRITPLLASCRQAGLRVIHAPSEMQARQHPERLPSPVEEPAAATWPPQGFRDKTGPFARFARPVEPRHGERMERKSRRTIHPSAWPQGDEVVVANGEQLHRYCEEHGILFLLYAGFNTNAFEVLKDYGIPAMSRRGYEIILLRDCTTAMESSETAQDLRQTREATRMLEMFSAGSITAAELISGLPAG